MLTLITYYTLDLSPEDIGSSRILAAFNMLAIFPLIVSFILDLFLIFNVIAYILNFILSTPARKNKYYASLNKKRYEQTDTRL